MQQNVGGAYTAETGSKNPPTTQVLRKSQKM